MVGIVWFELFKKYLPEEIKDLELREYFNLEMFNEILKLSGFKDYYELVEFVKTDEPEEFLSYMKRLLKKTNTPIKTQFKPDNNFVKFHSNVLRTFVKIFSEKMPLVFDQKYFNWHKYNKLRPKDHQICLGNDQINLQFPFSFSKHPTEPPGHMFIALICVYVCNCYWNLSAFKEVRFAAYILAFAMGHARSAIFVHNFEDQLTSFQLYKILFEIEIIK